MSHPIITAQGATMHHLKCLVAAIGLAVLAACGGGGDAAPAAGNGGANAGALSCDTGRFAAGAAVAAPTSSQLGVYAGRYVADEGGFGPNPGDPFVKSGTATLVLAAAGTATYNTSAVTVASACVETLAGGAQQLVLHFSNGQGLGHVDLVSSGATGTMTGVSPASAGANFIVIQNGVKQ
jgi:hypothetical protein